MKLIWGSIRNFFADYFEKMRTVKCVGCGRDLTVCDSACREAKAIDRQLMSDIK